MSDTMHTPKPFKVDGRTTGSYWVYITSPHGMIGIGASDYNLARGDVRKLWPIMRANGLTIKKLTALPTPTDRSE